MSKDIKKTNNNQFKQIVNTVAQNTKKQSKVVVIKIKSILDTCSLLRNCNDDDSGNGYGRNYNVYNKNEDNSVFHIIIVTLTEIYKCITLETATSI